MARADPSDNRLSQFAILKDRRKFGLRDFEVRIWTKGQRIGRRRAEIVKNRRRDVFQSFVTLFITPTSSTYPL